MRSARRTGTLETNPIMRIITAWESSPLTKRVLGLKRAVRDPQKIEEMAAAKLGAPMINPNHISVCWREYRLMS